MGIELKTLTTSTTEFIFPLDNIYDDPYSLTNIFYSVAKYLGYSIRIAKDKTNISEHTAKKLIPVMAESPETIKKLRTLFLEFMDYNISALIEAVELGEAAALKGLLVGNDATFYEYHPVIKIEKELPLKVAQSCFLTAYERLLRRPVDDITQRYIERLKPAYKNLNEQNVRPIDPEALGLLIIPIIEEIQASHLKLKP